jgi:hypothetical protein
MVALERAAAEDARVRPVGLHGLRRIGA